MVGSVGQGLWDSAIAAVSVADGLTELFEAQGHDERALGAMEVSYLARRNMWSTPAPTLAAVTWKLEQAIIAEDLQDYEDHPLNYVLRDLRLIGAH